MITKKAINRRLDMLNLIEKMISAVYDGLVCKECRIVQGRNQRGVEKYYCSHLSNKIDMILQPISKELANQALIQTGEFI